MMNTICSGFLVADAHLLLQMINQKHKICQRLLRTQVAEVICRVIAGATIRLGFAVETMFGKNHSGFELGSNVPHKALNPDV